MTAELFKSLFQKLKEKYQSGEERIMIQPYMGYGTKTRIYCYGRVLKDANVVVKDDDGHWQNLINSALRMESDEVPNQPLSATFESLEVQLQTNTEGYFLLDEKVEFLRNARFKTVNFNLEVEADSKVHLAKAKGKIMYPGSKASFGVISDVDDTVMSTYVLSDFKLKALYNILLVNSSKRKPVYQTNKWYQKLHDGTKKNNNPVFYISNSPWNLYEYINTFLDFNNYPKGPVLLRDFGLKHKDALQTYKTHKYDESRRILETYPDLPFVLIGDGGEKDADIYLKLKFEFPAQVKAIFVHRLGSKSHQARIDKLAKKHSDYFFFIKDSKEGMKISKKLGLIG